MPFYIIFYLLYFYLCQNVTGFDLIGQKWLFFFPPRTEYLINFGLRLIMIKLVDFVILFLNYQHQSQGGNQAMVIAWFINIGVDGEHVTYACTGSVGIVHGSEPRCKCLLHMNN